MLHDHSAATVADRADCIERMRSYVYYRIGKQILWFANEIRDCQENDHLWSRLLTGAFLAALTVAALHAFHLYHTLADDALTVASGVENAVDWGVLISALAIALPPLGTACLGIKGMYNFRGRVRIYEHEKARLQLHKGVLEALILDAESVKSADGGDLKKADVDFRAIALRTENSLSFEMEQWLILMERQDPELSP